MLALSSLAGCSTHQPAIGGHDQVKRALAGVPQAGERLGHASAPVEVVEYADLQCPFCARFARLALPSLVERGVRTGNARVVIRLLHTIGPDSERGALAAWAAGRQGRLWSFVDIVYLNQGTENAGWLDDAYLARVAAALGLDVPRFDRDRSSVAARRAVDRDVAAARADGIDLTPTFLVRGPAGSRRILGDRGAEVLQAVAQASAR